MRRTPLLLLPLALTLACPSNPKPLANDPDPASEPAGREPVFVEREPQTDPSKLPKLLTPEIANLYRCWFREPYDYMFTYGGATFDVNGRSYGMFSAGISGLLYYGGLSPCAAEQTGTTEQGWGNPEGLAVLAGVPTRNPNSSITQFTPVNPEFVLWARKTLLVDPEALIDGHRAQDAYDRVFQRFFRLTVLSALALVDKTGSIAGLDAEARLYLADTDAGAYGIDWLEGRYVGLVLAYNEPQDGTTMTAAMAAGFWLRRQLDGSLSTCWHGMIEVVALYDRFWLAEQRSAHAQAFAQLDALVDPGA
ncbi:hypothetical protein ACNOYE_02310 [Nannocystaceae bacterium ST9]